MLSDCSEIFVIIVKGIISFLCFQRESEDESDLEEEEMVVSEDDKAPAADETSGR